MAGLGDVSGLAAVCSKLAARSEALGPHKAYDNLRAPRGALAGIEQGADQIGHLDTDNLLGYTELVLSNLRFVILSNHKAEVLYGIEIRARANFIYFLAPLQGTFFTRPDIATIAPDPNPVVASKDG